MNLEILNKFEHLNVNRSGERRAPHKPLLLLLAIANLQRDHEWNSFAEIEDKLRRLLKQFGPPTKRQQPELPYWHLQSDGLWELNKQDLPRQKGGFPTLAGLRATDGRIPAHVAETLKADPDLLRSVIELILDSHFPESLHAEIVDQIGLDVPEITSTAEPILYARRRRDPSFRDNVLRAYEHRCAVTGFRVALAGSYFGCEAAHVQWHAYNGPDSIDNGIALEPTMHKLFDAGAWTLTDDRRVLVSSELTGSDDTTGRLRAVHGKTIHAPLDGNRPVAEEYIRWHREPDLGGVFRMPPLPL